MSGARSGRYRGGMLVVVLILGAFLLVNVAAFGAIVGGRAAMRAAIARGRFPGLCRHPGCPVCD